MLILLLDFYLKSFSFFVQVSKIWTLNDYTQNDYTQNNFNVVSMYFNSIRTSYNDTCIKLSSLCWKLNVESCMHF